MATDATGATTALGIPKFNTSADAPSGLGSNAQMDSIDALIQARVSSPALISAGEVPVWNGAAWVRSTTTNISPSSLGATPDATKFLRGDGTWGVVSPSNLAGYPNNTTTFLRGDGAWSTGGMTLIQSQVVSGAASIVYSAIPQTYRGLRFLWSCYSNLATEQTLSVEFNGDSAANYSYSFNEVLNGVANVGGANATTSIMIGIGGNTASVYNGVLDIPSYTVAGSSGNGKHAFGNYSGNASNKRLGFAGGGWTGSVAISSLTFFLAGGALANFAGHLYGIA